MRRDDWLDEDEYPDDKDIEAFGDDSPFDYDPLSIGYFRRSNSRFWTTRRIVYLAIGLILLGALLLPFLLSLLN